jgi:prevent-host-death family protein
MADPAPPRATRVDLPGVVRTIPATDARNAFGQLLDAVTGGQVVAVTRHNAVHAIVVPVERYRQLVAQEGIATLETLDAQFETLYARMQDERVRLATAAALAASPEAMGCYAIGLKCSTPQ